jgi:hypothetical protein
MPGAPLFSFTSRYAVYSTSSLKICRYIPQKRLSLSDFAATYIFCLRSCTCLTAPVLTIAPPFLSKSVSNQQAPSLFRSFTASVSSVLRGPVRHPLTCRPISLSFGYMAYPASVDFSTGVRRTSPVASHNFPTMPSLLPRSCLSATGRSCE